MMVSFVHPFSLSSLPPTPPITPISFSPHCTNPYIVNYQTITVIHCLGILQCYPGRNDDVFNYGCTWLRKGVLGETRNVRN